MTTAKIWILINAIFYMGLGLYTIAWPQELAATLSFTLNTPGAVAEIKACYGGLMFILGVMMIILYVKEPITYSLGFIALLYFGFGVGRLIGIIGNQAFDRITITFSAVEIVSFIISLTLYSLLKK